MGKFCELQDQLDTPETVLQIPVKKTTHVAACALHINEGTHDGIAAVYDELERQAGISHPDDNRFRFDSQWDRDLTDFVILNHLDLGSIKKYLGIQLSRVIEANPRRRIQFPVPVLGLFHLEMATEESLQQTYIQPGGAWAGMDSIYEHIGILRPREAGLFVSAKGPGYLLVLFSIILHYSTHMHTFIHHETAASILDCWRIHVTCRNGAHRSLKDFAESKPTWETIVEISEAITHGNIASGGFASSWGQEVREQDMVFENLQLKLRDFLLYVELHHAMTHGDISRVEATLVDWSLIFKVTGKHKYAAWVTQTLMNLNHVFLDWLRQVIAGLLG
ncbi:hypothetical protein K439DRAFT_1333647 [Ramaria rubella]|nr:hypothetical protein K439DRAFT_1333647 [Ramaria rubella]